MKSKISLAHSSLHIEYMPGIHKMRAAEAKAAKQLDNVQWDVYIASPTDKYQNENILYVPVFRFLSSFFKKDNVFNFYLKRLSTFNMLLVRIKYYLFVNKLTQKYDYVLLRYNSADFCAYRFLKRRHKILSYHHCNDIEELKLYSKIGSLIERLTRKSHQRGYLGIVGITPEIVDIASEGIQVKKKCVLTNGMLIDPGQQQHFKERPEKIKFVMISSVYHAYQGLELLIESIKKAQYEDFEVHFAGNMKDHQLRLVRSSDKCVYDGIIDSDKVQEYLQNFTMGIGPLALSIKGIKQASALKVGEYLLSGLPVVVDYEETRFPADFPYIYKTKAPIDFDKIIEYSIKMNAVSKEKIASDAAQYLNHVSIMKAFIKSIID
ncbi:MAG TPA: glycosyltransferase [Candidatus Cloacimonadota bacterium]|nr:glycosyltransferase [Candidatus Cloacimonadota bacterium]